MTNVELTIKFMDGAQSTRSDSIDIETSYPGDLAGEHRVAHILFTELKVTVGEQAVPKHNAVARRWLDFPGQPAGFEKYFDIQNSQALWLELANLIMGAEGDLVLAAAFKALEPAQEPSFDDDAAINDLYYVHDRKMTLLNQSVHGLIKVQDLVNRLLHESLSVRISNNAPDDPQAQTGKIPVAVGILCQLSSLRLSWVAQLFPGWRPPRLEHHTILRRSYARLTSAPHRRADGDIAFVIPER